MTDPTRTPPARLREIAALATLAADRWPRGDPDGFDGAFDAVGYAEDNLHEIEAVITDGVGFARATSPAPEGGDLAAWVAEEAQAAARRHGYLTDGDDYDKFSAGEVYGRAAALREVHDRLPAPPVATPPQDGGWTLTGDALYGAAMERARQGWPEPLVTPLADLFANLAYYREELAGSWHEAGEALARGILRSAAPAAPPAEIGARS